MFTKTTKEVVIYVSSTHKYSSDTRIAVDKLAMPILGKSTDPLDNASKKIIASGKRR